jgi:hypothetical protein
MAAATGSRVDFFSIFGAAGFGAAGAESDAAGAVVGPANGLLAGFAGSELTVPEFTGFDKIPPAVFGLGSSGLPTDSSASADPADKPLSGPFQK